MKINHSTRISTLIKVQPKSIETLISIDERLSKLRKPVLRKLLARRVTIGQVAKMMGKDPIVFFKKLVEIGFELDEMTENKSGNFIEATHQENESIVSPEKEVVMLDVRPVLDGGEDPFDSIMQKIATLQQNQILEVINSFEPIPLINVLKTKGYKSITSRDDEGLVHVQFYMESNCSEAKTKKGKEQRLQLSFEEITVKFKDKMETMDVRALEMPLPMVNILQKIEVLEENKALFVFHKKFPQFLVGELEERGFQLVFKEIDNDNVHLIIFK